MYVSLLVYLGIYFKDQFFLLVFKNWRNLQFDRVIVKIFLIKMLGCLGFQRLILEKINLVYILKFFLVFNYIRQNFELFKLIRYILE